MATRTDRTQLFDRDGNLISETVVDVTYPDPPDYGNDALDLAEQAAPVVQQLRGYVATASPTNVQTVAALKLLIRAVLYLMRRSI